MTMIDHGGHDPLTGIDAIRVTGRREADAMDSPMGAGIGPRTDSTSPNVVAGASAPAAKLLL